MLRLWLWFGAVAVVVLAAAVPRLVVVWGVLAIVVVLARVMWLRYGRGHGGLLRICLMSGVVVIMVLVAAVLGLAVLVVMCERSRLWLCLRLWFG